MPTFIARLVPWSSLNEEIKVEEHFTFSQHAERFVCGVFFNHFITDEEFSRWVISPNILKIYLCIHVFTYLLCVYIHT